VFIYSGFDIILLEMECRNYEFRLYPSRKQIGRFYNQFNLSCKMYNLLLTITKDAYKANGKHLTKVDLNNTIKKLKDFDTNFKGIHSQVLQNCSDRLSKAFQNFFRRVKERKTGKYNKVGFPRYKNRVKSITYPQSGFKYISDKKLYISKIGNVPIVLHRLLKGTVKTMTVKRAKSGKWFVVFSCELEPHLVPHPFPDRTVGIDVGLESFATLSDGTIIENPRYLIKSENKLKRLQKRLSRKKKCSRNRGKAIHKLAIQHETVAHQRKDFLHKTSHFIANHYNTVAVENLNINGMLKNHHLAKHIQDASWGTFLRMNCYKAESAGGRFVVGDPFEPTSQKCSGCGAYVQKSLGVRIHKCPVCGLSLHRDLNAAINIRNRVGHTRIDACGDSTATSRPEQDASGVVEPGTILG
jgi:putative transposase